MEYLIITMLFVLAIPEVLGALIHSLHRDVSAPEHPLQPDVPPTPMIQARNRSA